MTFSNMAFIILHKLHNKKTCKKIFIANLIAYLKKISKEYDIMSYIIFVLLVNVVWRREAILQFLRETYIIFHIL